MNNLKFAAACSLWLAAAGSAAAGRQSIPSLIYPAAVALAGAVTAAVLVDNMLTRRGDEVTASCLAAMEIDRRLAAHDERPHLQIVPSLSGS